MSSVRPTLKPDTPQVITAWDVRTGRPVYRTHTGLWSPDLTEARIVTGEDVADTLAAAKTQETLILDPYAMEVSARGGIAGRETVRETIRVCGPTVRGDLIGITEAA